MQCVDSVWTEGMHLLLAKRKRGTGFDGQHGRHSKRGHERMIQDLWGKHKNCHKPTACAEVGLTGQRLSLHQGHFSSVTPLPRQAAERVSAANDSKEKCWTASSTQWQWHRKSRIQLSPGPLWLLAMSFILLSFSKIKNCLCFPTFLSLPLHLMSLFSSGYRRGSET